MEQDWREELEQQDDWEVCNEFMEQELREELEQQDGWEKWNGGIMNEWSKN